MSQLSDGLKAFWNNQIANNNDIKAAPFSGNCMFCNNAMTEKDEDHSVCNTCWADLGEEE
jgi:Zn finger protein HypA/HybF involved in hydrogenase expression